MGGAKGLLGAPCSVTLANMGLTASLSDPVSISATFHPSPHLWSCMKFRFLVRILLLIWVPPAEDD